MSGFLGASSLPRRGGQLAHLVDWPLAQFRQDLQEVFSKIDVQASARLYNRGDSGNLRPGRRAADVQPIFAAKCQRANAAFAIVVVTLQVAVREVFLQSAPLSQGVVARLDQLA